MCLFELEFLNFIYLFILAVLGHGTWDLSCGMQTLSWSMHAGSSSLTRDRTWAPCTGSMESYPLDHQGKSLKLELSSFPLVTFGWTFSNSVFLLTSIFLYFLANHSPPVDIKKKIVFLCFYSPPPFFMIFGFRYCFWSAFCFIFLSIILPFLCSII